MPRDSARTLLRARTLHARGLHAPRPTDTRSPRYRLLAAAAKLADRRPQVPTVSFEVACPACGHPETFTQRMVATGTEIVAEDHACL